MAAAARTPAAAAADPTTKSGMSKAATRAGSRLPRVAVRTVGDTATAVHHRAPANACRAKYALPHQMNRGTDSPESLLASPPNALCSALQAAADPGAFQ